MSNYVDVIFVLLGFLGQMHTEFPTISRFDHKYIYIIIIYTISMIKYICIITFLNKLSHLELKRPYIWSSCSEVR